MTIKNAYYPPFTQIAGRKTCYDKQSKTDKIGMKGDRAEISRSYDYIPQGMFDPIKRPARSLRMKRGDTKLLTLAGSYVEFWWLVGLMNTNPTNVTLAGIRQLYGKASITGLRKAIRRKHS
ncbi:MAG: hypothetical protein K8T10_02740 [Candidatus Eremiobacteraeota bacterium]|nr:hypothetical protein [Candidatus Eremiobacteraeota bacterium]